MAAPMHEWDAKVVQDGRELEDHLVAGWEPLGMAQVTLVDRMTNRPAGVALLWAVRRRVPRLDLSRLTAPTDGGDDGQR